MMSASTLLIRKTRTWRKISPTERWLLLQALILLPAIACLLTVMGLKRTHRLLMDLTTSSTLPGELATAVRAVKIAARYYPWATCLRKSLVLWFLLRRRGIAAELQIGTRFEQGEFQAHAWVECQGCVVGDRQEVQKRFATFAHFNTSLTNSSKQTPVRPEIELLCCLSSRIDTATAKLIESLLQQTIDWNYLLQQASQQGVVLLFCQNLFNLYPERIPHGVQAQLQAYCQSKMARNLFLSKKLCQILELLQAHDIQVIPFKGSVLAASAYGSISLREFCDIDLIIKQEDFPRVKNLLLSQGYRAYSSLQAWGQTFTNQDDSIHLDLHWQIAPPFLSYRVNFQQLWQRCKTVPIFERQVVTLSSEDALLVLCAQFVKDTNVRKEKLKQVCDIARIASQADLDWQRVVQPSDSGGKRLLLLGLALADRLLHVELPAELKQEIATSFIVSLYLEHIEKQILDNSPSSLNSIRQGFVLKTLMFLEIVTLVCKRDRAIVSHLFRYFFQPNTTDRNSVLLPRPFHVLYYFVRPVRLATKLLFYD